jgi:hypothetical protein
MKRRTHPSAVQAVAIVVTLLLGLLGIVSLVVGSGAL